jgi:ureidoacrylate peracid hydrolase
VSERYEVDPAATAFLVVDMTNDFLEPGVPQECPHGREMVPRLAELATACRAAGIPVIYTSHMHRADGSDMGRMGERFTHLVDEHRRPITLIAGTRGVEVVDELAPVGDEIVIRKSRYSSFFNTDLETVLRHHNVTTLIIGGVATNVCCESTARDAMFRDYKVIFLSDGNATIDFPDVGWGPVSHEEVQRVVLTTLAAAFCDVATTAEVLERIRARPQLTAGQVGETGGGSAADGRVAART